MNGDSRVVAIVSIFINKFRFAEFVVFNIELC